MRLALSAVRQARFQRGISLMELMISMTIGLFLLAGLVTVYLNSAQSSAELNKSAQQIENGRFAMQTITDDLRHAGYYGQFYSAIAPTTGVLPDPCDFGGAGAPYAGLKEGLLVPIQGYGAWNAALSACLPATNYKAGTDIVVVRRADSNVTTGANFEVGRLYVQANASSAEPNNPIVAPASATTGTLGTGNTFFLVDKANQPAPVRRFHVHVYFVSPCSRPAVCTGAATDDGIPTLKRLELVNGGFSVVPIAEGIENLQLDYAVDADGDGGPETPFVENPATPQVWANVVAVKVNLIARALEQSAGYSDPKTYRLGEFVTWTPTGADLAYKRHAYSELARIVNVSARRELQ
jgi:type IV pilus assembly protein PilW